MKNGAILVNKHPGITSFGIIERLRTGNVPMGHGGTLDPFATGLVVILVGKAVKLARYFLGAMKSYEGTIEFGITTLPGDPTAPISESSEIIPDSLDELRELAHSFTLQDYSQIPPMYSAKKKNGKPLYLLARAGIEIERPPQTCHLYEFQISDYQKPHAFFKLTCSSGTYVRTLAQDFGKRKGSLALLRSLNRTGSGVFDLKDAWSVDEIIQATQSGKTYDQLPCWIPIENLLKGYAKVDLTPQERQSILQGKNNILPFLIERRELPIHRSSEKEDCTVLYCDGQLIGVIRKNQADWRIERVFSN